MPNLVPLLGVDLPVVVVEMVLGGGPLGSGGGGVPGGSGGCDFDLSVAFGRFRRG